MATGKAPLQWGDGRRRASGPSSQGTCQIRFAGHDPMIIRARLLSRGTRAFYQVRAGAETRTDADKLCAGLRRAGGHCLVLRNPRG